MTMPTDSKYTEIYRKRLSESLKGKRASEETKRIQSEAKMSPNKSKKRVHKYSSKEYQRNKEKYLERQRRYRENPEKRAEYFGHLQSFLRQNYIYDISILGIFLFYDHGQNKFFLFSCKPHIRLVFFFQLLFLKKQRAYSTIFYYKQFAFLYFPDTISCFVLFVF